MVRQTLRAGPFLARDPAARHSRGATRDRGNVAPGTGARPRRGRDQRRALPAARGRRGARRPARHRHRAPTSTIRSGSVSPARSRTSSPRRRCERCSRTIRRSWPTRRSVADRCEFDFEKRYFLPGVPPPRRIRERRSAAASTWHEPAPSAATAPRCRQTCRERLDYELARHQRRRATPATSSSSRTSSRAARDRGIPVGPGRGSAAGSLVAYALGITNV